MTSSHYLSNVIRLDQEAGVGAKSFRYLAEVNEVRLQFLEAQPHNSIESVEKYKKTLGKVFRILLRQHHPNMEPKLLLQFSVKELK